MNADQKIKLLHDICDRNPHTRLNSALWKIRKAEKAEELRRPVTNPRILVKMYRKLTGRA